MYRRYLSIIIISLYAGTAGAFYYPSDTESFTGQFSGNLTSTIITGATAQNKYTILSIRMQQEKDLSTTAIYCGAKELAFNWAKDYTIDLLHTECDQDITLVKTGQDKVFVSVNFVRRDLSLDPVDNEILASASFDRPIPVYNSMTAGDIAVVIMLFILIMIGLFNIFISKV